KAQGGGRQAELNRRQKIWQSQLEKYRDCNIAAARGIATQSGDPMSLALAARGMCGQVEGPLRKALIDAYADVPGISSHAIENVRQRRLDRNAAEIVAGRAANGNGSPQLQPPLTHDY